MLAAKNTDDDLQYLCRLIEERAGINLKPTKYDLVRTRLRSRIAANGLRDFGEYRRYLSGLPKEDPEWEIFTNLLTTNKTDFFREPRHFDFLVRNVLPQWLATKRSVFQVWSAAASSGEEAYTLAMVLSRYLPRDKDFRIFGTDIDTEVLRTARNAVYPIAKKDDIPLDYGGCIDIGHHEARGWFRIKPALKAKVSFESYNLVGPTGPSQTDFDLVLCRNVLIYFKRDKIELVQKKIFSHTRSGGHLLIGHSESLQGIAHQWQYVGPSIFRKG